jgi:hypothetical protein
MAARKKKTAKKRTAPKGAPKTKRAAKPRPARGETDIRRTAIHWALEHLR